MVAPTFMPIVVGSVSALDASTSDKTDVDWFGYRYAFIISRSVWFETSDDEWICWPEDAARTSESGVNKDGKLGDLPIHVFVAQKSDAFDSYKETLALQEISTVANVTMLPDASHTFIFETRYTEQLVEALLGLMSKAG